MSKTTPTPWQVEIDPTERGDPLTLIMPKGGEIHEKFVAHCAFDWEGDGVTDCTPTEAAANAEFIVLACNSHDDLLAACELALSAYDEALRTGKSTIWNGANADKMRAAVAKAKAK